MATMVDRELQKRGGGDTSLAPTTISDTGSFLTGAGYDYDPTIEDDAQFWQYASGGDIEENPYLAYMKPREYTDPETGKKFMRIPKNQTLMDLADYFDGLNKDEKTMRGDLAQDFIDSQDKNFDNQLNLGKEQWDQGMDQAQYDLDIAKHNLSVNKNNSDNIKEKIVGWSLTSAKYGMVGQTTAYAQETMANFNMLTGDAERIIMMGWATPNEFLGNVNDSFGGGGFTTDMQEVLDDIADKQTAALGTKDAWYTKVYDKDQNVVDGEFKFYNGVNETTRDSFKKNFEEETGEDLKESMGDTDYFKIFPEDRSWYQHGTDKNPFLYNNTFIGN